MAVKLLHQLLEQSARRAPSAQALRWKGQGYTYSQVEAAANVVAKDLLAKGIRKGDRVGLFIEKSPAAVVAIYGILKTGAAYVPLDARSPIKRIAYILEDCTVRGLITTPQGLLRLKQNENFGEFCNEQDLIVLEMQADLPQDTEFSSAVDAADLDINEDDLAYILYTSGSTGQPKGVMLSHRAGLSFATWGAEYFKLESDDKVSSHAPFHFDLSIFDLFSSAAAGACVCLIPSETMLFPHTLAEWIAKEQITVWYSAPTALTQLVLHGGLDKLELSKLRDVLFAGEVFPTKYLKQLQILIPQARFHNLYGPSETNVCTMWSVPQLADDYEGTIPIGKACADLEVFAINEKGILAEVDEVGELYVYGPGLMLGYWAQPEKTKAVLAPHPLHPEMPGKTYRTGDLVRQAADGNYHFIGRRDHQVKSRGYRIELGEIEATLIGHADIIEAVVMAVPDEELGNLLHAYIVLHPDKILDHNEISSFCRKALPAYMIPAEFHLAQSLPKTSTGKIDRTRLASKQS